MANWVVEEKNRRSNAPVFFDAYVLLEPLNL